MILFKNNNQNQEVTCLGKTFSSKDEQLLILYNIAKDKV